MAEKKKDRLEDEDLDKVTGGRGRRTAGGDDERKDRKADSNVSGRGQSKNFEGDIKKGKRGGTTFPG